MKTDTYTKVILTIIAFALTANLLKGFITPAKAEDNKKYINLPVNADGNINVQIKGVDQYAFSYIDAIPVKQK